jgi:hypothetical protein
MLLQCVGVVGTYTDTSSGNIGQKRDGKYLALRERDTGAEKTHVISILKGPVRERKEREDYIAACRRGSWTRCAS